MSDTATRRLIYVLFALSGFAGLIYESIWSHYLKLFLGHAAYAQSLVLAIFMGGMAIGSWLVAGRTERSRDLLKWYALVEGLLAVAGIFFHQGYQVWMDIAYNQVIPALSGSNSSIALVQAFKWTSAALLILPQTILLGMTFPLVAGALLRVAGHRPGQTIAILYFTNSFGASLGVLTSGFVLIGWVGLPGTTMAAGFINAFLAVCVLLIARRASFPAATLPVVQATSAGNSPGNAQLLLLVAALTGTASFIYEIAWVRMLAIVLGSSTHAFELMLSAFIMGLALGGWWVRRHIDRLVDLPRFLGYIQVVMGICALASLVAYNYSFEAMAWIFHHVEKTGAGYRQFNLYSQAIAYGVMLPATFCAGMTLPLITSALLRLGAGERSIGHVYAVNTLGSIVGVFATVHLLLPYLGLKGAICVGAGIDLLLGMALVLQPAGRAVRDRAFAGVAAICLVAAILGPGINQGKLVSSVIRSGEADVSDQGEMVFHRDGKTASISVFQWLSGKRSLSSNGKVDAAVQQLEGMPLSVDESTMTQLAALPLAAHPTPGRVAVIGLGVGMTADMILADERVHQLDIIEIEEQVVAAAGQFAPRFQRPMIDPRSTVYIEDARTFFALSDRSYDVIVSEPSNTWVSGVSSLFTRQFYRLAARNLAPGGIVAQWIHIYEMDMELASTIFKAIAAEFADYQLYAMNGSDFLVIAGNSGVRIPDLARLLGADETGDRLFRVDIRNTSDLHLRWLGDRSLLQPFFDSYPVAANDDFYPVLDLGAARTRFLDESARELLLLPVAALPIQEMLAPNPFPFAVREATASSHFPDLARAPVLAALLGVTRGEPWPSFRDSLARDYRVLLSQRLAVLRDCPAAGSHNDWPLELTRLAAEMESFLSTSEQLAVWHWLLPPDCLAGLEERDRRWVALVTAVAGRDARAMQFNALSLLREQGTPSRAAGASDYAVGAAMLASLALGERTVAAETWRRHGVPLVERREIPFDLRLLASLAAIGPGPR